MNRSIKDVRGTVWFKRNAQMLEALGNMKKRVLSELPFEEAQAKWVTVDPPDELAKMKGLIDIYSFCQLRLV